MSGNTRQIVSAEKKAFLAAYARLATVTHAAEAVGIARQRHYEWMRDDPDYPARFEAACEQAVDKLEREVVRRGAEGVDKPVYQGGKLVGSVREYSDTLLIFALKGLRPEKYRDRYDVKHEVVTLDAVDAEIRRLEAEIEAKQREQAQPQ